MVYSLEDLVLTQLYLQINSATCTTFANLFESTKRYANTNATITLSISRNANTFTTTNAYTNVSTNGAFQDTNIFNIIHIIIKINQKKRRGNKKGRW